MSTVSGYCNGRWPKCTDCHVPGCTHDCHQEAPK